MGRWAVRQAAGKVCPACISETVRCRKLILGRDIDLAVVTLSLKILSKLYLGNRKMQEVDTW